MKAFLFFFKFILKLGYRELVAVLTLHSEAVLHVDKYINQAKVKYTARKRNCIDSVGIRKMLYLLLKNWYEKSYYKSCAET